MPSTRVLHLALAGVVMLATGASTLLAQAPTAPTPANPWVMAAPYPRPPEEVLGAPANATLYVFAGLAPGFRPRAFVFEFDPASNQWSKKKPMKLPAHHVAFTSLNNKIYAFGGFVLPQSGPPAWDPVNNAWE